ncbi:MAG TPA: adenine phosphoribosyltransferase [Firmicutes bacterium]|nr:adenine phosphoribosyltransferase [Candidatus Fermentithermobacillaceae bacterium]
MDVALELGRKLRVIPDFPVKGISFKDITPILGDARLFRMGIDALKAECEKVDFDMIVAPESRGFIVASALSYAMGKPFAPVRKKGKLPWSTIQAEYQLEYGVDILEMHEDAVKPGQKVLVIDDLLATGGTTSVCIDMVERLGGTVVATAFLIELTYLPGRANLEGKGYKVLSVLKLKE